MKNSVLIVSAMRSINMKDCHGLAVGELNGVGNAVGSNLGVIEM